MKLFKNRLRFKTTRRYRPLVLMCEHSSTDFILVFMGKLLHTVLFRGQTVASVQFIKHTGAKFDLLRGSLAHFRKKKKNRV